MLSSRKARLAGAFVAVVAFSSASLAFALSPQDKAAPTNAATAKSPAAGDPYTLDFDVVTGEKLPGKPVARVHEGRRLLFASEENAKKFEADPASFKAKLDEAMIAAQAPFYPLTDCVVSGHAAAGDPIDIVKGNRLFRLCCADCVPVLEKDPAKFVAKLDAAVIAAQKPTYALDSCPISGKKLGSMGEPLDVVAGNRLVRLCCGGCTKKFESDPRAVFAKLDAAKKN